MASQRPWMKLWTTALRDPDLEALTLEDWARWCRLALYTAAHGTDGVLLFKGHLSTPSARVGTGLRGVVSVLRIGAGS